MRLFCSSTLHVMINRKCKIKEQNTTIQKKTMRISLYFILTAALLGPSMRAMELPLSAPIIDQKEALFQAMRLHDKQLILHLVRQGAPVTMIDHYGRTILAYAAATGYKDLAEEVIKAGADINQAQGIALHDALMHGHLDMAKYLLQSGANPALNLECWSKMLKNFLMQAVHTHEAFSYGILSNLDAVFVRAAARNNTSVIASLAQVEVGHREEALSAAVNAGSLEAVKVLFNQFPELNANRFTVSLAQSYGLFELLLEHGALPEENYASSTVDARKHRLLLKFNFAANRLLIRHAFYSTSQNMLECAVTENNYDLFLTELEKKPSQLALSQALAFAVGMMRDEMIPPLLAAGADTQPALKVLSGKLLWPTYVGNRDHYKKLYQELATSIKTVPSLKDLILDNTCPTIKAALIKGLWHVPSDLQQQIMPDMHRKAQLYIARTTDNPFTALTQAFKENRTELRIPLLRLAYTEFCRVAENVRITENYLDDLLRQLNIQESDQHLLRILLIFTIEKRHGVLMQRMLMHPRLDDFFISTLAELVCDPKHTQLHHACLRADVFAVLNCIKNDPKAAFLTDSSGYTILMLAILKGSTEIIHEILENPNLSALLGQESNEGLTPLMLAAKIGDDQTVLALLKKGTDPRQRDFFSLSALAYAAAGGHDGIVTLLLEHMVGREKKDLIADFTQVLGSLGSLSDQSYLRDEFLQALLNTALEEASKQGHLICANLLIDYGARVRPLKLLSDTNALILAMQQGHIQLVRMILAHELLLPQKHTNINGVRFSSIPGNSLPLIHACRLDNAELVDLLVKEEANVGSEVIHEAARSKNCHIVAAVLENVPEFVQRQAFERALQHSDPAYAKIIIENGLRLNSSVLVSAILFKQDIAVKLILEQAHKHGMLKDFLTQHTMDRITDARALPPLLFAVRYGTLKSIQLLISLGADPWERVQGVTALGEALAANKQDVVEYLQSLKTSSWLAPLGALWRKA